MESKDLKIIKKSINAGKILMMLFLATLPVGFVVAGDVCLEPADDTDIVTSVVLCGGTYYVNDTNGDGVLRIVSDNVVVDFNGSTLIGNGEGKGIIIEGRNVTIKNGKVKDYWLGADIAGNYTKLRDFEVEGGDFGVVVETAFGVDVRNVYCHGVNDACLHDFDQSPEGLYVYNLTCDCICNWCAYLPHSTNVTITDSNLHGSGVKANDATDFKVLNTVVNVTDSGGILSEMGGSDFQINNSNIIVNTNQPAISFANGQYSNIIIYNTDLSGNGESVGIDFESCSNNCVIEGVTVSNFNNGVFSNTSAGISILDSEFTSISDIGIHLGDGMSDITVSNVTVVSGGTPFECLYCDNVLVEDSFFNGTGGFFGIGLWDGSGATVTRNEVYTVGCPGLMIETNNTVVSFNNVSSGVLLSGKKFSLIGNDVRWGNIKLLYVNDSVVYNNTLVNGSLVLQETNNVTYRFNKFINTSHAVAYENKNFDVIACNNTLDNVDEPFIIGFFGAINMDWVAKNVMRPDSDSCTPYVEVSAPTGFDLGTITKGTSKSGTSQLTIKTNLVEINITSLIDLPDWINAKLVMTKEPVDGLCLDANWNSIDCSDYLNPARNLVEYGKSDSKLDGFKHLQETVQIGIEVTPVKAYEKSIQKDITMIFNPFGTSISKTSLMNILFNIFVPSPVGGGAPVYRYKVAFVTVPYYVNVTIKDASGNVVFSDEIHSEEPIYLDSGDYTAIVSAVGYPSKTISFNIPEDETVYVTLQKKLGQTMPIGMFNMGIVLIIIALIVVLLIFK